MIQTVCRPALLGASRLSAESRSTTRAPGSQGADAPLVGLVGSDLAGRFRHWRGASGRRYLFSVFPLGCPSSLDGCPRYQQAVVLAVSRAEGGTRRILCIGGTGHLPDLFFDGDDLKQALAAGANEIHMHLLSKDQTVRDTVMRDLAGRESV